MVTAVVSCLRFYKILKSELVGHKPLSKLFAFKLMVGINFLMTVSLHSGQVEKRTYSTVHRRQSY